MSIDNECGYGAGCLYKEALIESLSAERDSLRAANAELLEALKLMVSANDRAESMPMFPTSHATESLRFQAYDAVTAARAAIASARKLKG